MDPFEDLNLIESTANFIRFKSHHPNLFLASLMITNNTIQANYYLPKEDKMVSFTKDTKEAPTPGDFVRTGEVIAVDIANIQVSFEQAFAKALELSEKNYPHDKSINNLTILHCPESNPIWSIAFLTPAGFSVNIKIDAITGNLISHSKDQLLSFMPGNKGK